MPTTFGSSLGNSFTPGQQQGGGSQFGLSPGASEALKIISLRLPSFLGGNPIAPDALLRGGGGGGAPDALLARVNSLMRAPLGPQIRPGAGAAPNVSFPGAPSGTQLGAPPITTQPGPRTMDAMTGGPGSPFGAAPTDTGGGLPTANAAPPNPNFDFHMPRPGLAGADTGAGGGDTMASLAALFGGGGGFGGRFGGSGGRGV